MPDERIDSELFIGLISTTGTDTVNVIEFIRDYLKALNYKTILISVTDQIMPNFVEEIPLYDNEYDRIMGMMNLGNKIRNQTKDNAVLMKGVVSYINSTLRPKDCEDHRIAYIIKSIKHPDEVKFLRSIYSDGFHLLGISSDKDRRTNYLTSRKNISPEKAETIICRDEEENDLMYGQHTRDAYQESDYFISIGNHINEVENAIHRLMDLLFGNPYIFPTFDEYAMFMAYSSSLRSADLSRQVGAVIAKNHEIISQGANDCPKAFGGLYWTELRDGNYCDEEMGRDFIYQEGYDSNKREQQIIIDQIIENLQLKDIYKSLFGSDKGQEDTEQEILNKLDIARALIKRAGINNLTEYGRIVHAEMESLLMCARNTISCRDAEMYVTTFPCHNCAKHIIAAGIKRVIYIEPYPKSKAFTFYPNEITENVKDETQVQFIPFIGVGPHKFIDLFAMHSTTSYKKERKDGNGDIIKWNKENASLRNALPRLGYRESEEFAYTDFTEKSNRFKEENENGRK